MIGGKLAALFPLLLLLILNFFQTSHIEDIGVLGLKQQAESCKSLNREQKEAKSPRPSRSEAVSK